MTPTAAQQRAVQDKPSTMAGGIQGVRWALGISYRQGSPLVPPAHAFLCATSPGAQHRILAKKGEGINGGAVGGGEGKEEDWLVAGWQCASRFMHLLGWHPILK